MEHNIFKNRSSLILQLLRGTILSRIHHLGGYILSPQKVMEEPVYLLLMNNKKTEHDQLWTLMFYGSFNFEDHLDFRISWIKNEINVVDSQCSTFTTNACFSFLNNERANMWQMSCNKTNKLYICQDLVNETKFGHYICKSERT